MGSEHIDRDPQATWPWASILLVGTFGRQSTGARRYHRRTFLALGGFLILFPVLMALASLGDAPAARFLAPLLGGALFAFVGRELWRYVSGLDEMERTLQLEAMSLTYLIGMPVFVTAHFAGVASAWSWHFPPLAYILLDIVRAIVLARLTRRYS
jgi:hypothetical protein